MDEATFIEQLQGTRYVNAPGELPPVEPPDQDGAYARPLPQSMEAEQSLLGGLLLDPAHLARVSDILTTADFFAKSHQLIFDAVSTLVGEGQPIDTITAFERLQRDGHIEDVGGLEYLNKLAQSVPSAASVRRYAEIIVERATRRRLLQTWDVVAKRIYGPEPVADILADSKAALGVLAEERKLGKGGIPALTLMELRDQAHELDWVVKNMVPADSIGLIFGASQTFKSFIAIDMAMHVAHGLPWMGRRTKKGPVVIIAAEGGRGMWGRLCAWHKARKLPYEKAPVIVIPIPVDMVADAGAVVAVVEAKLAAAGLSTDEPLLTIVDTLSQTFVGEENSANEVAAYFREIGRRIRERWHCAVGIVHHSGHNATERPRGSTAMGANTDWMFGVHRDEKEMLATLSCAKLKDGEGFSDAMFSVTHQRLGTDKDGDEVRSLVARHLSSTEEVQEVMEREAKAGRGGHNSTLMRLLQNGMLESDLRQLFGRECGLESADSKRQAYLRAKSWAVKQGFFEVAGGFIVTLKQE